MSQKQTKFLIGANVHMAAPGMFPGAVPKRQLWRHELQFYLGAPQNTRRKPVAELAVPAGLAAMQTAGLSHLVIHAPYIVNLGNTKKPESFGFAVQFMREEIARADALQAYAMPFHPGLTSAPAPRRQLPKSPTAQPDLDGRDPG